MSEEQEQLVQDCLIGQADFSDPPPPGTACEACRERGHFCPARGYVVDCAVCAPCAAGFACAQETAVQRVHEGLGYAAMEAERPVGECRSVPLSEATPPVEERSWISDDWKRVKAGLSHANLVAAAKERRVRERPARVARAPKPKPLCVDGCGAEVRRRSKSGRCAACKAAAHPNQGATQPRRVRAMSERVMCAGGCGRKLHHLTVKAGGRYASGCSEGRCKAGKTGGGGRRQRRS